MTQEENKIEEAAEIYSAPYIDKDRSKSIRIAYKNGAISQAAKEYHTKEVIDINSVKSFIEWKSGLSKNIIRGKVFYDVPRYHKFMTESELLNYWFEQNKKK